MVENRHANGVFPVVKHPHGLPGGKLEGCIFHKLLQIFVGVNPPVRSDSVIIDGFINPVLLRHIHGKALANEQRGGDGALHSLLPHNQAAIVFPHRQHRRRVRHLCRAQAHPLSPDGIRFIRIVPFQVLHSPAVSASLQFGPGAVSNAAGSIEHAIGFELTHLAFIVDFSHDLPVKAAQHQPWQIAGAFQFHHQLLKPIAVHIQLCIPGRLRRFLCAHPLCQYPAEFGHGVRIVRIVRICKIPVVKPDPVPQNHSLPVLRIRHCAGLRRHGLADFFRGLLCCKILQAEIARPQNQHKHGSHGKNLQRSHHRPLFPDDSQPPLPEGIRLLDIAALHTAEHFQKLQFRHLRPSFSRYVSSLPRMR